MIPRNILKTRIRAGKTVRLFREYFCKFALFSLLLATIAWGQTSSDVVSQDRPEIPDPVVDAMEGEFKAYSDLVEKADLNGDRAIQREEWTQGFNTTWYHNQFLEFDGNSDKQITAEESRLAFEIAYGICNPSGERLRRETGYVFNWRFVYLGWDRDRDRVITFKELSAVPTYGESQAKEIFSEYDSDQDGQLTLTELQKIDALWIDIVNKFRGIDLDKDGFLTPRDLATKAQIWERPYLPMQFPACDTDRDGVLSFAEYRGSPLGNSLLKWEQLKPHVLDDGHIGLMEFHPLGEWKFIGLSKIFFDKLDRDGNQYLDLNELELDWELLPAQLVIAATDRDHNQRLTLGELFTDTGPVHEQQAALFQELVNLNENEIDLGQLKGDPRLVSLIKSAHWWRIFAQPQMLLADTDQDGLISIEELSTGAAPSKLESVHDEFRLFDFDQNAGLSLSEYGSLLSSQQRLGYGNVFDPVRVRVMELQSGLMDHVDAPPQEVLQALQPALAGLTPEDVQGWDLDQSKTLSAEELRHGLEIAMGLREPQGNLIRTADGKVFHARSYRVWDKNGDWVITREEFSNGINKPTAGELFDRADANQDQRLSIFESRSIPFLWKDTVQSFLKIDQNRDGELSLQEFLGTSQPWEVKTINLLFPAFDTNRSGGLSFREFRMTPLANPLAFWENPRLDQNFDGRLSLEEFHADKSYWLIGLSQDFLNRFDLDQDRFLSKSEFDFKIDMSRAPLAIAFSVLDVNNDQGLSLQEAMQTVPKGPVGLEKVKPRQSKLTRIEDTFYAADTDRNSELSLEEFTNAEHEFVAQVTGRRSTPPVIGTRFPDRNTAATHITEPPVQQRDWRFIGLIGFNLLLVTGVSWLVYRSSGN